MKKLMAIAIITGLILCMGFAFVATMPSVEAAYAPMPNCDFGGWDAENGAGPGTAAEMLYCRSKGLM
ncbi:MAG: hypothetical protein KKB31_00610 [Nanoarchaeota archaeon]|nr:hypothetical protein [Nanoarchaeota archaeon]